MIDNDSSDININHMQGPEAGWPLDQGQQTRNILPVITDQSDTN